VAEARHAGQGRDPDLDLDLSSCGRSDAQAALERAGEVIAGGAARVGADSVGAGGGAGGGGGGPRRVADQGELPERDEQRGDARQERDELGRGLAAGLARAGRESGDDPWTAGGGSGDDPPTAGGGSGDDPSTAGGGSGDDPPTAGGVNGSFDLPCGHAASVPRRR
jgi:hypothetical protein